jgi:hypothetical protein
MHVLATTGSGFASGRRDLLAWQWFGAERARALAIGEGK